MTRVPDQRWRGRPVLSACLRFIVFVGPIGAAVLTSALVAHALPRAAGRWALVVRVAITIAGSTVVLVVIDRLARRLLPLAVLLRLSLAFPGEAPSRITVARSAGNLRELEERVRIARTVGFVDEPARTAEMILSLVAAVEAHDKATRGHSERVRVYTDLLGEQLKLHPSDRDRLRWSALLHDVGKLEVPRKVLNKPGPLSAREMDVVRRHPGEGARHTRPLHTWLGEWAAAIEEHHERWDGRGYPKGLAGTSITLGGRIVCVADSYETMTAARPYHKPKNATQARQELVRCAGTQFDPTIVRAFLGVSVGRLRWASGPLSWLAQSPFLRGLEGVAGAAGRVATGAAAAGGVLAVAVAPTAPAAPAVAAAPARAQRSRPSAGTPVSPTPTPSIPGVTPSPTQTPITLRSPPPTTISRFPSPSPSPSPTKSPGWLSSQFDQTSTPS